MEFDYLLRIFIAGICGALIGYERKNRMKEAGIRTHFIVAVGASLMMVISKYGFQDQLNWNNLAFDPSRIAAQVVTGVGFLGAGMIFMQRQTITGLTTAAGIWATAGVGMAVGSGMYSVGVGVALLILLAQKLLHARYSWLIKPKSNQLTIRIANEPGAMGLIQQWLKENNIAVISLYAENISGTSSEITIEMIIKIPEAYTIEQLMSMVQDISIIKHIETH